MMTVAWVGWVKVHKEKNDSGQVERRRTRGRRETNAPGEWTAGNASEKSMAASMVRNGRGYGGRTKEMDE